MNQSKFLAVVLSLFLAFATSSVQAEDAEYKADSAVADILFEYDGSEEFASYSINSKGFVDITFAKNMPDEMYSEIMNKLRNHPDIDGVLGGKTGPMCGIF